MSDQCINRLVVVGPVEEIRELARAAIGFESPDFRNSSTKPVKLPLSFTALYNLLPTTAKKRVPQIEQEPDDLTFERLVTSNRGNGQKIYRFMLSRYDPGLLLIEVSKLFPRLCFILGWVAPNIDEAASKFIRMGRAIRYNMPGKRRSGIRASKYKEWDEDCLDADMEADWIMLDEVVSRWDTKLATVFKGVKRQRSRLRKRPG